MKTVFLTPILVFGAGLAGCVSTKGLEQEIAAVEARVRATEAEITTGTASIGGPGKDVRAEVSYRPLISWAKAFSDRPAAQRTIQFRQKSRGGSLYEKEHECYFEWGWHRTDGKRAWVHEAESTKIDMEVGRFAVIPTNAGLDLSSSFKIDGKTQVGFNYRPACLPSVGGNIGVTAEARPSALLRVTLVPGSNGIPRYRLAVVSPNSVGLEMRADFNYFRVGFTIPIDNLARELASGDLNMLFAKQGKIILPGGEVKTYRLATIDPTIATSTQGIAFGSNIEIVIE